MKNLLQIYGKYIAATWGIILLLLAANIGTIAYIGIRNAGLQEGPDVAVGVGRIASALFEERAPDQPLVLSKEGEELLTKYRFVFLFVLDDEGDVIYRWRCPEDFPNHYTVGEVASFSRWYFRDYPVKVWNSGDGLLVAGRERGSTWKMTLEYSEVFMSHVGGHLWLLFLANMAVILFVIVYLGYRFYRSLQPLSEGIDMLSRNRRVRLSESGSLSALAARLNRTSDILEKQREFLERRDSARTEWIAGVSHDIRTPLAVIMGYADRLESEEPLSGRGRECTEAIKAQSMHIRKLIEDLNLTSKLEYHMQPLRVKMFHPAALLRDLAAQTLNEGHGEQYGIELSMDDGFEKISIQGDEELLARAVKNLVNNSIRHNPQGCMITVRGNVLQQKGGEEHRSAAAQNAETVRKRAAAQEEGERPRIRIAVTDTGVGIPREVIEALHATAGETSETDAQGDAGAAEQRQGVCGVMDGGTKPPHIMGLRIAAQIAEAHGGFLAITEDGHRVEIVV